MSKLSIPIRYGITIPVHRKMELLKEFTHVFKDVTRDFNQDRINFSTKTIFATILYAGNTKYAQLIMYNAEHVATNIDHTLDDIPELHHIPIIHPALVKQKVEKLSSIF